MPKRKQRDGYCWRQFQKLDMFGFQIGFNIDGYQRHNECCGWFCSFLLLVWMILLTLLLVQDHIGAQFDRPTTLFTQDNYYGPGRVPITSEQGFRFAVGVSNPKYFTTT